MESFANHATRRMSEFKLIMPTVAHYLEHILIIPNFEYKYDSKAGKIKNSKKFIDSYSALTKFSREKLLQNIYLKEKFYLFQEHKINKKNSKQSFDDILNNIILNYQIVEIKDQNFTQESIFDELKDFNNKMKIRANKNKLDFYLRLKCTNEESLINLINKKSHKYLKNITLNFIDAWLMFLFEEIKNGNFSNEENSIGSLRNTQNQIIFLKKQKEKIL